jgi:DNA (cytosine-5)-methyltransferase 1
MTTDLKAKLLDLFCGAGGAGMGYSRAGFDVYGIDIKPQPHYPFPFLQMDALDAIYDLQHGMGIVFSNGEKLCFADFAAFHASPPCQANTVLFPNELHGKDYGHKDCIPETRLLLLATMKPWVIENVPNANMNTVIILCGQMFGLKVFRHRLFESNIMLFQPPHMKHKGKTAGKGRYPRNDEDYWTVTGHLGNVKGAGKAMGIDWMLMSELVQAIPPVYTEYIGKYLMEAVHGK